MRKACDIRQPTAMGFAIAREEHQDVYGIAREDRRTRALMLFAGYAVNTLMSLNPS
jgi:hypothetical protein